ncbi:MAG: type II secretion system protein [Ketobacter sp.]
MTPIVKAAGLTLVELIIAIVIVSVAFVGMMSVYAGLVSRSADPMIYQQSLAIADSFMEEIASKEFPASFSGACPAPPDDRSEYADVCDYHTYSATDIEDVAGNDMGLDGYGVSVEVVAAGSDISITDNNDALKVTVTVSHPLGDALVVTSYRTRY